MMLQQLRKCVTEAELYWGRLACDVGLPLQVDFLLSRLKVLYERIDDTEDLINIELDHR